MWSNHRDILCSVIASLRSPAQGTCTRPPYLSTKSPSQNPECQPCLQPPLLSPNLSSHRPSWLYLLQFSSLSSPPPPIPTTLIPAVYRHIIWIPATVRQLVSPTHALVSLQVLLSHGQRDEAASPIVQNTLPEILINALRTKNKQLISYSCLQDLPWLPLTIYTSWTPSIFHYPQRGASPCASPSISNIFPTHPTFSGIILITLQVSSQTLFLPGCLPWVSRPGGWRFHAPPNFLYFPHHNCQAPEPITGP